MTKSSDDLIPPDFEQCQAMLPQGPTFMYLGPPPKPERCPNKPTMIATEKRPGKDGKIGSMSLCYSCYERFLKAFGPDHASVVPIVETTKESPEELALLLIGEVQQALVRGTIHIDPKTKRYLPNTREVLLCLQERGKVDFIPAGSAEHERHLQRMLQGKLFSED